MTTRPLTRRSFMGRTSAGLLVTFTSGVAGGRRAWAADSADNDGHKWEYVFPVLGDIHYDDRSHHDMEWVMREKPRDIRQIEGYVKVTREFTPRLLARTAEVVRQSQLPVPMVVQVGDFTEGLCGSFELQSRQFRDACAAVEKADLGAPFLITKGNHDITGPGATEAYDQVLLPWMGKQAGRPIPSASYTVRHGEDLFVFFDAYKPDLDWLEATLRDEPARHTFFIVHPPVVPYNERANWHLFARPNHAANRERLLLLLGGRGAIVLGGHLHKYSVLTRETPAGSFTQFAVNSVIRAETSKPRKLLENDADYGTQLLDLDPDFAPHTLDERRAWLDAEKPHVSGFEYADCHGYAVVRVAPNHVEAAVYNGLDTQAWKTPALLSE